MELSLASMLFGARALVVKEWKIDPGAPIPVCIKGRKAGLLAWFLSFLKLDATTTFELHANHVSLADGSLAGQIREIVPLSGACNIGTGYLKPFGYILAAVGFCFWAIVSLFNDNASGWAVVWQLVLAVGSVIAYFLNRCLVLYVKPVSSSTIQIAFKRSVIEGVDVDEETSRKVVRLVVDAIMDAVKKGS